MNRTELDVMIEQGEGVRLEFKRTLSSPYRIARTLAAFANTAGGTLLIGVADDGRKLGVSSELREMQKIEQAAGVLVDPPLGVSYQTLAPDGRKLLILTIAESDEKPHYVIDEAGKRTIYVRAKDKSVPTNKLIISADAPVAALVQSPSVRTLIQYLRRNDDITAEKLAKLTNISAYRADKQLKLLTEQGLLLLLNKQRPARYALKLAE